MNNGNSFCDLEKNHIPKINCHLFFIDVKQEMFRCMSDWSPRINNSYCLFLFCKFKNFFNVVFFLFKMLTLLLGTAIIIHNSNVLGASKESPPKKYCITLLTLLKKMIFFSPWQWKLEAFFFFSRHCWFSLHCVVLLTQSKNDKNSHVITAFELTTVLTVSYKSGIDFVSVLYMFLQVLKTEATFIFIFYFCLFGGVVSNAKHAHGSCK